MKSLIKLDPRFRLRNILLDFTDRTFISESTLEKLETDHFPL